MKIIIARLTLLFWVIALLALIAYQAINDVILAILYAVLGLCVWALAFATIGWAARTINNYSE